MSQNGTAIWAIDLIEALRPLRRIFVPTGDGGAFPPRDYHNHDHEFVKRPMSRRYFFCFQVNRLVAA